MKKLVRSFALLSALAVLAAGGGSMAQDKKADPKKPADTKKPEDTKKPDATKKDGGSIEVYKNDKGKWRYKILNGEGKTIAMPLPQLNWESKADAEKAVAELKTILNTAKPTEVTEK